VSAHPESGDQTDRVSPTFKKSLVVNKNFKTMWAPPESQPWLLVGACERKYTWRYPSFPPPLGGGDRDLGGYIRRPGGPTIDRRGRAAQRRAHNTRRGKKYRPRRAGPRGGVGVGPGAGGLGAGVGPSACWEAVSPRTRVRLHSPRSLMDRGSPPCGRATGGRGLIATASPPPGSWLAASLGTSCAGRNLSTWQNYGMS